MLTKNDILQFRQERNINQLEMAKKLGISRNLLNAIENDRLKVSKSVALSFQNLLRAESQEDAQLLNTPIVSAPDIPYHIARLNRKNSKEWPGIPVWESSPITATNTEVYHDEKIGKPDFYLDVPQLRDCNYAGRARGDSMHPKISNGDIVIGKEMTDLSVIMFGEIYIIHTRNGIETVKYIHPVPGEDEKILLVPANEKAKSTPIMKSDILRLFEYRAVFKI